jgi:hypothetical protein
MKHNLHIRIKKLDRLGGGKTTALHKRLFQRRGNVTLVVSEGAVKSITIFDLSEDGEPDDQ